MSRIQDFGQKLEGAAKDRWKTYRHNLNLAIGNPDGVLRQPLSESFPEPPYLKLLEDGIDQRILDFIRSARDLIPNRPRHRSRLQAYAAQVHQLRDLASDLIEGRIDPDRIDSILESPSNKVIAAHLKPRMEMYEKIGHARSLKPYVLSLSKYSHLDGVSYAPPLNRWEIVKTGGRHSRPIVSDPDKDAAIRDFARILSEQESTITRKPVKFDIISYRGQPARGFDISKKVGGTYLSLMNFPTLKEARAYLRNNPEELERRLEQLKDLPPERGEQNRSRSGMMRRAGDVSPEEFHTTFRFRGVQFGNYVEVARRQKDLNRAYDALMDLADILECPPHALSLNGTLGLAFGARGRGGVNPAAAHFEPLSVVINLTKTRGAGSLAHEWFHALDNHLERISGGSPGEYASGSTSISGKPRDALLPLARNLHHNTSILERSRALDQSRSSPYFGLKIEIAARAFEAYVIEQLENRGVSNDYLANISDEAVFEAWAAMRGQPAGRYPYPRAAEMEAVCKAFDAVLNDAGIRTVLDRPQTTPRISLQHSPALSSPAATPDEPGAPAEDQDDPSTWSEISF